MVLSTDPTSVGVYVSLFLNLLEFDTALNMIVTCSMQDLQSFDPFGQYT